MLSDKSVSLVIPILNERASLPSLLAAIHAQTTRPHEIIFVDAGSTDGSQEYIESWYRSSYWGEGSCRVLSQLGAMPGAGRNAGIRTASCEWIAFLDGGITPEPQWLEALCRVADSDTAPAVMGTCQFWGNTIFEKGICALSYGQGSTHAVLPVSLFHRSVFDRVGLFRLDLRAGEDILWQQQARRVLGEMVVSGAARAFYTHFPTNLQQAFQKWRRAEFHCIMAGVRLAQIPVYLLFLPIMYALLFAGEWLGSLLFVTYILLRGVGDPMRRSATMRWWGDTPGAFWIPLWLAPLLDLAKLFGILQGIWHISTFFPKGQKKWNG